MSQWNFIIHNLVIENYTFKLSRQEQFSYSSNFFNLYAEDKLDKKMNFLVSFFRKWKLLGIENKSTSAIKLKKKSNYWKKIVEEWLASHTLSTLKQNIHQTFSTYRLYERIFISYMSRLIVLCVQNFHFNYNLIR